jgi:hypothetical protein
MNYGRNCGGNRYDHRNWTVGRNLFQKPFRSRLRRHLRPLLQYTSRLSPHSIAPYALPATYFVFNFCDRPLPR